MQKKYISDKIQHLLMIKTLRKVKIEDNFYTFFN